MATLESSDTIATRGKSQRGEALSLRQLRGTLQEARSGLPLGGVRVAWLVKQGDGPDAVLLRMALGITDSEGAFTLEREATPDAERAVCMLAHDPAAQGELHLLDASGEAAATFQLERGEAEAALRLAGDEPPAAEDWATLGNWLQTNRQVLTDRLAEQLLLPEPDSPTQLWPVTARAAALAQIAPLLGQAPAGLDTVPLDERPIDFSKLTTGDVIGAVRSFDRIGAFGQRIEPDLAFWRSERSEAVLYRDYLRGVCTTAAQRMYGFLDWQLRLPPVPESLLVRQLAMRLHQDFRTGDDQPALAAGQLAGIIAQALVAPKNRGGFGLTAAQLPQRGALDEAAWLDALVAAAGVSRQELRNRYRVRFDRAPEESISPVWLNVEALIGFMADTWQALPEPFPAFPAVIGNTGQPLQEPIVFPLYLGHAPFFLHFNEWKDRQARFFPENLHDPRRCLPVFAGGSEAYFRGRLERLRTWPSELWGQQDDGPIASLAELHAAAQWITDMLPTETLLRDAVVAMDAQNRVTMQDLLVQVEALLRKRPPVFVAGQATRTPAGRDVRVTARARGKVDNKRQLDAFEAWFDLGREISAVKANDDLWRAVALLDQHLWWIENILLPWMRATAAADAGDDAAAIRLLARITGFWVGAADPTSAPGHPPEDLYRPFLYVTGGLPYTLRQAYDEGLRTRPASAFLTPPPGAPDFSNGHAALHVFELRFFSLAQGEAMLRWADGLFRTDDPDLVRRARELYKGVILLHGEDAGIDPQWPWQGVGLGIRRWAGSPEQSLIRAAFTGNPAIAAQVARSRLALFQIERGLNAFGYAPDLVPLLRYRPLKAAADLFAERARSAQADLLTYQARFEDAQIETWRTEALGTKAGAAVAIAGERSEIAKVDVAKAEAQVKAVEAQIAAKQAEINDADSLFNQFKTFLGGIKDAAGGLGEAGLKVLKDDSPAQQIGAKEIGAALGKAVEGGSAKAAVAGLGTGFGMAFAFGAFAYAGYTGIQSIVDADNKRRAELTSLRDGALPAAKAAVRLKQRDVEISRLEGVIAQADLDLARKLVRFQRERFLNAELWRRMAGLARRLLQRYLDMAARAGWLAERALAFEQVRDVRVMRLAYGAASQRQVGGPDLLQADLAELEAQRLHGIRLRVPLRHTISLARDLPLTFGRLKKIGKASFSTDEAVLRRAYPGTFGHRIRAVTIDVQAGGGATPRGMLLNHGISEVGGPGAGPGSVLVRFPDGLPLSEFRLREDMWVHGLPGEALMQFEGSGFGTAWDLVLPPGGAPLGLTALTDVLLTFDLDAGYDPAASVPPPGKDGAVLMAASAFDAAGLATLRAAAGPARIRFDLGLLPRATGAAGTISNLAVLAVGPTGPDLPMKLRGGGRSASFALQEGIAASNAGKLASGAALPLNALVGLPADAVLELELDRTGVASALRALDDVLLFVERSVP